jgi:hypothetical protein
MAKRSFTGLLRTPINLSDARASPLEEAAGLPASERERVAFHQAEIRKRLVAFDRHFGLPSGVNNIWERRAKALLNLKYNIAADCRDRWRRYFFVLAKELVPGFSTSLTRVGPGAPKEWTDLRLAELLADVTFLKRKQKLSERQICTLIGARKGYGERWGSFRGKPQALRKALTLARKRFKQPSFLKYFWAEVYAPGQVTDPIDLLIKKHALKR